eukprot:1236891-Prymnesium_polylepis.1
MAKTRRSCSLSGRPRAPQNPGHVLAPRPSRGSVGGCGERLCPPPVMCRVCLKLCVFCMRLCVCPAVSCGVPQCFWKLSRRAQQMLCAVPCGSPYVSVWLAPKTQGATSAGADWDCPPVRRLKAGTGD